MIEENMSMSCGPRRGGWFSRRGYGFRRFTTIPDSDNGVLRFASDFEDFVKGLTGAYSAEIENFTAEFMSNREFQEHLERNLRSYSRGFYGIGPMLGVTVYNLCRKLKPTAVIETGVSGGVSSAYILCALDDNKYGELYSIDLPWGEQSGWIIPDYLRNRWHLELGRSSEKLPPLCEKLGVIDIFLHDSEHSYQNMFFEYQTAWAYLKVGGLLLSHNVSHNRAFSDFCQNAGVKGFLLDDMGGVLKV
jgi:predicted O-methyltransferase YrrM